MFNKFTAIRQSDGFLSNMPNPCEHCELGELQFVPFDGRNIYNVAFKAARCRPSDNQPPTVAVLFCTAYYLMYFIWYTAINSDAMRWTMTNEPIPIVLQVAFFCTDAGTEPVRDWLKALEPTERRTIGEDIKTVQVGWPLGMPLVRKLEQGLWEVRISLNHKIARVLFTIVEGRMVLSRNRKKPHRLTWTWQKHDYRN